MDDDKSAPRLNFPQTGMGRLPDPLQTLGALLVAGLMLIACADASRPVPTAGEPSAESLLHGEPITLRHAEYLQLERRGEWIVAHISAPVADQGYQRQRQSAIVVLVPSDQPHPVLTEDLREATVIRTPVTTVAANSAADEAFLVQLDARDTLVAVGGLGSYDDAIRAGVRAGDIAQIGYNWHAPPNLDVLLQLEPDVFMMRLSDLAQAPVLTRARNLGLTVLPTFAEEEPDYLGRAEWIRFYGMMLDKEEEAEQLFASIEASVAELKNRVVGRTPVPTLWAYPNGADRWVATVRGAEAAYLRDAGGLNLMAQAEDPDRYSAETVSTEAILPYADAADVWILGDLHAVAPRSTQILQDFRAWREENLFGNSGRSNQQENAHDWYQTAMVRPDWVLQDFVKALHPELVNEPFRFLKPLPQGQYQ